MRIRILKATVCGGENVAAGDEVEASDKDARFLIGRGKAEKLEDKPKKKAAARKSPLDDKALREDDLETRG